MIETIKKQILTEEPLPNIEKLVDFYNDFSYIIDPIRMYGLGKFLIDVGQLMQELSRKEVEQKILDSDDSTINYGDFVITKRVTQQYLYPETPKMQEINEEIEKLKQKSRTLTDSIKNIHKHMQITGDAIKLDPKVAITVKY
jgi:DNA/RNA-binding domain of Phe-tRNA-synthetase-like protein